MKNTETLNGLEIYNRILSGKPYGKNLIPYSKEILECVIDLLKEDEEYEKCLEISNFIKYRFNHDIGYNEVVIFQLYQSKY